MNRFAALAALVVLPLVAEAQSTAPCTYDRCALRIEDGNALLPGRVVQGIEGRPVDLHILALGPDSVRIPYEQFRSRGQVTTLFAVLSVASLLAVPAVVHMSSRGPGSTAYYFLGGSVVFGASALIAAGGSQRKLEEAIERYNDRLPDRR